VEYEIADIAGNLTTAMVEIGYLAPVALATAGTDAAPGLLGAAGALLLGALLLFAPRRRVSTHSGRHSA